MTNSKGQGRSVDGTETVALTFTFGDEVGKFLGNTIRIKEGTGEAVTRTEMFLPGEYKSEDPFWLGHFIGKAVRIWQQNTGRHNKDDHVNTYELLAKGREGVEDVAGWISQKLTGSRKKSRVEIDHPYNYRQLYLLEFNSMQHAEAVKHWFYVSYSIEYRRTGSGNNQIPLDDLYSLILDVMDVDEEYRSEFDTNNLGGEKAALRHIVNNQYGCVIKELRDPKLLQRETRRRLVPTANTQITSWGDIRTGGKSVSGASSGLR